MGHIQSLAFWHALQEKESFDPARTVFVDDNVVVLQSARDFGVEMLLHITRPDTQREARSHDEFTGIEGVGDLT